MPHQANTTPRWYARWRSRAAGRHDDAADFGTAFGLDLSLSEMGDDATTARPAATARSPGWIRRWARRRNPAP